MYNWYHRLILVLFLCFVPVQAQAAVVITADSYAVAPSDTGFLDDIVDSVVMDLDATIAASYDGSGQTWSNLIATPADGAAQTAYDFFLGVDVSVSTDDPTFNGSAGNAAAFWSFDGGDLFDIKSGVNTNLLRDLHKTINGTDWWIVVTFGKSVSSWGTGTYLSTFENNVTTNGLAAQSDVFERFRVNMSPATAPSPTYSTPIGDHLGIVTYDTSTQNFKAWATPSSSSTGTVNQAAGDIDASIPARIGMYGEGNFALTAVDKLYSVAMGNAFLTDVEVADIFTHFEARHGRDYTP